MIYQIVRIDEPDFGCEGRPEHMPVTDTVCLRSPDGREYVRQIDDALLYRLGLEEGDWAAEDEAGEWRPAGEMKTREDAVRFCSFFPGVWEDYPFHDDNWTCMRTCAGRKIFAMIFERQGCIWINVKCDPQWRDVWREMYAGVLPAYHMNKEHWNSVLLDGTVPKREICRMIAESYDLCLPKKRPARGEKQD